MQFTFNAMLQCIKVYYMAKVHTVNTVRAYNALH